MLHFCSSLELLYFRISSPIHLVHSRRFLRARKFDIAKAHKQLAGAAAWREKHDVDRLFANFDTDEMEKARSFYPMWTGRRDKNGIPLYVYKISALKHRHDELDAISSEKRYQRIVVLYEIMWRLTMRLASVLPHPGYPETPISSTTSIIDLDGVSLNMLWNFRSHLQVAATLATANYPETLHTIVVVNSPSYFPTAWSWIKGWFDETTRSKIHILSHDPFPVLKDLVQPQDVPKVYGGELEWQFGDQPSLDDDARKVIGDVYPLGAWEFDDGTRKVIKPREDGKRLKLAKDESANDAVLSGSEAAKDVHAVEGTKASEEPTSAPETTASNPQMAAKEAHATPTDTLGH
jgi:hypothetical protein